MRMSAKAQTLLLLSAQSQRELAVFALFHWLEVWLACRLDRTDQLRRSGIGQERRRDSQATVLLHHAVAWANCAVFVRVSACAARCDVENGPTLVHGTSGESWRVAGVLRRWAISTSTQMKWKENITISILQATIGWAFNWINSRIVKAIWLRIDKPEWCPIWLWWAATIAHRCRN